LIVLSRRFQQLAIQTLKNCHQLDEMLTEQLLTKPCPWWGKVSVVQLAILTHNREFMSQTACKDIMTRIWKGQKMVRACVWITTHQLTQCE
jgi:hypothetical protein